MSLADRFGAKVPDRPEDQDACWEWAGSRTPKDYGKIAEGPWHGRTLLAHRVAWALENGPIPEGVKILHHCDNPPCVRAAHLFPGTTSMNHLDSIQKGRWGDRTLRGVLNPGAKLDDDKVREIRRLAADGRSLLSISQEFGVSWPVIDGIVKGRGWAHVTELERAVLAGRFTDQR